jgi:cyclophilin family peptidyl-prolyl cis-trans isomerase
MDRNLLLMCSLLLAATVCGCNENGDAPGLPQGLGEYEQTRKTQDLPVAKDEMRPEDLPYNLGPNPNQKITAPQTGTFKVKFETTAGDFVVEVHRDWSPLGAQRFYELVQDRFYDGCRFFRVVPGFVVQFGINGTPEKHRKWNRRISDDKVVESNRRGTLCFATSGPDSRTTQLFVNYSDNASLDAMGFSVFGEVIEGFHNVEGINPQYGEQPQQNLIEQQGNAYLERAFPELDYVKRAVMISEGGAEAENRTESTSGK